MDKRSAYRRRTSDIDPRPGRMHWRRVPGTSALAITNGIAALSIFDFDVFTDVLVLSYLASWGGAALWASLYLTSAVLLTVAAITRRWLPLNIGSVLSLFAWSTTGLAIVLLWASGGSGISPIALAMVWWMVAGQATMLAVPLMSRGSWVA